METYKEKRLAAMNYFQDITIKENSKYKCKNPMETKHFTCVIHNISYY